MERSAAASKQRQSSKQQKNPQPAEQQSPPAPLFSGPNLQKNLAAVNLSRTYLAIIAGVVAGILGLTGISGFLCYIFVMALGAVGLFIKTGFHINKYFDTWQRIGGMDGLTQGAMVSPIIVPSGSFGNTDMISFSCA
ncbi:unnamed protein product [Closterium sp. NIES-53]